jgi:hypothetical protein
MAVEVALMVAAAHAAGARVFVDGSNGVDTINVNGAGPDVREGVASLREKRPPDFTGPASE